MDAKFYVPYETARELRLKGYPQSTDTWYVETAKGVRTYKKPSAKYESIARPTYHEVLDWIFNKEYNIGARVIPNTTNWYPILIKKGVDDYIFPGGYYTTREDALNAAIIETLKRI